MKQADSTFYVLNHIMSYNWARIVALVGARRRGKTYAVKNLLLNFIKSTRAKYGSIKHKIILFRDNEAQCDTLCENDGQVFWGDILQKKKWSNLEIKMLKSAKSPIGNIYINKEHAGYVVPITHYHKLKGSQFEECKLGFYDEFIPESVQASQGNMALYLLNILLNVASYRPDFKLIMAANALDKGNPILELLGVKIKGFGIYKRKDKGVILDYISNNEAFERHQKQGITYNLVKGTRYESNLQNNKFLDEQDDKLFYVKRLPCDLIGIYHDANGEAIRIYESRNGDEFYASQDTNPNTATYMRKAFKVEATGGNVRLGNNDEKKFLAELYKNHLIKFENKFTLNIYKNLIK